MNVPEGAQTISVEGRDLKAAIQSAAEQLGLHPSQVDYKVDLSHFRTPTGVSVARTTVKILAWGTDRAVSAEPVKRAPPPRPPREGADENGSGHVEERESRPHERRRDDREGRDGGGGRGRRDRGRDRGDRGDRDRGDRGDRDRDRDRGPRSEGSKPDLLRGPEAAPTPASEFAQGWFGNLLSLMDVQGTVVGTGSDQRIHLAIHADRAGRIVGKRGATLGAIRHLLGQAIEKRFGQLTIDVDVGDDRPREEREAARLEREQSDRRRHQERRGGDRERGGGGEGPRGEKGRYPPEKLRALARRAAEKAEATGQTITINLELNSFDRRIVHLEVSEMPGVQSQSEERMGDDGRVTKFVQIIPHKAEAT
jgi:predicted RNA-binding protein Jag